MTTKLSLYNNALVVHLGARKLAALSEAVESRRALDDVWDGGGVKACLQMGQWNFAIKSAQFDYDPSIEPDFGYQRVFAKPDDFVRTVAVCSDEYFRNSFEGYLDNNSYWVCDLDTIYVRYVSDDDEYGMDMSKWPPNFTTFVEAWFAMRIARRLTGSDQLKALTDRDVQRYLRAAKATDAMEEPTRQQPVGSWVRARHGGHRERTPKSGLWG